MIYVRLHVYFFRLAWPKRLMRLIKLMSKCRMQCGNESQLPTLGYLSFFWPEKTTQKLWLQEQKLVKGCFKSWSKNQWCPECRYMSVTDISKNTQNSQYRVVGQTAFRFAFTATIFRTSGLSRWTFSFLTACGKKRRLNLTPNAWLMLVSAVWTSLYLFDSHIFLFAKHANCT